MGKLTVYHGSYTEIKTPKLIKGQHTKDFGVGFYCTLIREQARRWAIRFDTPMVNIYDVKAFGHLNVLEFTEMSEAWLSFIVACRSGKAHDYDIVIGAMANDQIYNFIEDYLDGIISKEQFWMMAKFKYPTHQINFCTQDALACIQFRNCQKVAL